MAWQAAGKDSTASNAAGWRRCGHNISYKPNSYPCQVGFACALSLLHQHGGYLRAACTPCFVLRGAILFA